MEGAAGRRRGGIGDIAGEEDAGACGPAGGGGGLGHGGEEGARVGVCGSGGDGEGGTDLDDAAEVHDGDAVADVTDDGEVVCNKKIGESQALLEAAEEIEDLGLNGDVESGDGLIADDEVGFDGECASDTNALALAAAELVGVARGVFGGQADEVEEFVDSLSDTAAGEAVDVEDLANGFADGHAGIERAERILEDDLGAASEPTQAVVVEGADIGSIEEDLAGGRLDEAEGGPSGGSLAGAGFADEAEGLAAIDVEGNAIDGAQAAGGPSENASAEGEVFFEVAHHEQRSAVGRMGAFPGFAHDSPAVTVPSGAAGERRSGCFSSQQRERCQGPI